MLKVGDEQDILSPLDLQRKGGSSRILATDLQSQQFHKAVSVLFARKQQWTQLWKACQQKQAAQCPFQKLLAVEEAKFEIVDEIPRFTLSAHALQILERIHREHQMLLVNRSTRSQLFQLLLALKIVSPKPLEIVLFTSNKLLHHYYFHLNDRQQPLPVDESNSRKQLMMNLPGLSIRFYQNGTRIQESMKDAVIFFDAFGLEPTEYMAAYRIIKRDCPKARLVVHSEHQEAIATEEVLTFGSSFPIEIIKKQKWEAEVFQIIKESRSHGHKSDIILFVQHDDEKQELLKMLELQKIQYLVHRGKTSLNRGCCNIFEVYDQQQLFNSTYSFENVLCVFDSATKKSLHFDYQNRVFVEQTRALTPVETIRRMSFIGQFNPGKYIKKNDRSCCRSIHQEHLGLYVCRMIQHGFTKEQLTKDMNKKYIDTCLRALMDLKIVEEKDGKLHTSLDFGRSSLEPVMLSLLDKSKSDKTLSLLMAYIVALVQTKGILHNQQISRLNNVWMKTGDLSSCLQVLSILQRIIKKGGPLVSTKEEEPSSTISQFEFDVFGFLYEQPVVKPKLTMSEMNKQQFIKQLGVNERVAEETLKAASAIRQTYNIEFVQIDFKEEDVDKLCQLWFDSLSSYAVYTGSRRFGYKMSKTNIHCLPAKISLLVKLNSRPQLLLPLKMLKKIDDSLELLQSNKINETVFLIVNGQLPIMTMKSSFGDTEIEFNNIPTALFDKLWAKGDLFIQEFQKKHNCMVEPNHQTSSILIFSDKKTKSTIEKQFNQVLQDYRKQLLVETKLIKLNNIQLVCQKGGAIREILKKVEERTLMLVNLPGSCTAKDVKQLIEEYTQVESVELKQSQKNPGTNVAKIVLVSSKGVIEVYNQLHYAEYDGNRIYFGEESQNKEKPMVAQNCIKIKWFAWKTNRKGWVRFQKAEDATKAADMLKQHKFDDRKLHVALDKNTINLDGLSETTDEMYLRNTLSIHGPIEQIHLEKHSQTDNNNYEQILNYYIQSTIGKNQKYHIVSVKKKPNGLRIAKIQMNNPVKIKELCTALHDRKGIIGLTRVYAVPCYYHPFLVPRGSNAMFEEFFEEIFRDAPIQNKIELRPVERNGKHYIVVKSSNEQAFNLMVTQLQLRLRESVPNLSEDEIIALLSGQLAHRLQQIELKFKCRFVCDGVKKQFKVICKNSIFTLVASELRALAQEPQVLRVPMSRNNAKNLMRNPKVVEEIKKKFDLLAVQFDSIGKCLVIEGKAKNLQTAKKNISYVLQELGKSPEGEVAVGCCPICCDEYRLPYRLQACSHCFCLECLMCSVNSSFADATNFPIKCPGCSQHIVVRDLDNLLDNAAWEKLKNIATNDYVNKNSDKFMFCYTGNCKGIHPSYVKQFDCDVCHQSYCAMCKNEKHDGMTCEQAKSSTEALLKKFMQEQDVRICPNTDCKMLIQRIDGCYRVTCSRCQQSICWKCPRDSMPVYKTADECYRHLTEKHGGYW